MGKYVLGIDFAPGEVRALALRKALGRKTVEGFWRQKTASDEEAAAFLAAVCRELDSPPLAVVGLSRRAVFYREFVLPPLKKNAIAQAVSLQLVEKTPFEPGRFQFAYRLEKVSAGWRVEALAVANETFERYTALLKQAGFSEIAFAPTAQAVAFLAGKGDYLVGLRGETLQLGLAASWWSREISLTGGDGELLAQELGKTLEFLSAQTGRKPQLRIIGEGGWRPKVAGTVLEPSQILAGALAACGVQGRTLVFHTGEEEGKSFLTEPLAAVFLCLWLAVAILASFFGMQLRAAEEARRAQQQAPAARENYQELAKAAGELESILNQPPELALSVLRQLAFAPQEGEEYLSLTISDGEVKELVARSPKATGFIKRLNAGPLAALKLEGPIVESEGKEQFTLKGKVEWENDD